MWWMLKNSEGKPDAIFTCAMVSFLVLIFTVVAPMFQGFHVPWVDYVINIGKPDSNLVMFMVTACYTAYVLRRNAKLKTEEKIEVAKLESESGEVKND